jgi:hypothetical protein
MIIYILDRVCLCHLKFADRRKECAQLSVSLSLSLEYSNVTVSDEWFLVFGSRSVHRTDR